MGASGSPGSAAGGVGLGRECSAAAVRSVVLVVSSITVPASIRNSFFDGFRRDPFFADFGTMMEAPRHTAHGLSRLGATDVVETPEAHVLHIDVPGVADEDLHVELDDGVLTISGERKNVHEEKDGASFHSVERSYGTFQRSFRLPPNVDAEGVRADHHAGQLTVTLPKVAPKSAKNKKIAISRGSSQ